MVTVKGGIKNGVSDFMIKLHKEDSTDFEISFYSDAIVSAIKRWLNVVNLDCEHFSSELESILEKAGIYKDLN